ncbi:hypothetical protein NKR23_g7465 [Pleurostoma richardsiae]|uniref:BTB domain-containing protein n=1 Tax=Pleurostoma richardsiae TaxID=41990 RepID=A0AA38RN12_9PEZI|nr:hypothetical protein NKR23_g7465 [Pleurostoma richardsiae]
MRAPSTNPPDVVVLEFLPNDLNRKDILNPKEDLWLSTVDGRYNSPIIPVRVGEGPSMQVFQVHKHVLLKAKWFRKALCGEFSEAETQVLNLPNEDPSVFHFLVAFLYEGRYIPTKPLSDALVPDLDKGKGRETRSNPSESDSDSSDSLGSDSTLDPNGTERIKGEDMRIWLMAYELNIDVYTCANRYLMDDFKEEVARAVIDMLETAGRDAAQIEVLHMCKKLYEGVNEGDSLLKMMLARLGFLQPLLWKRYGQETSDFLISNPEIATLILRETATRREEDYYGRVLPSMERLWLPALAERQFHHEAFRPPRY